MSWWITKEPCYIPSLFNVLYTCPAYERSGFPSKAMAQFCTKRSILFLMSRIKIRHRSFEGGDEIVHELLQHDFYQEMVTVSLIRVWDQQSILTIKNRSCTLGFLWFNRLFNARIESFGWTDLERTWSDISNFKAISSEPDGSSSDVALSTGV